MIHTLHKDRREYDRRFDARLDFYRQQGCAEQEAIQGAINDLGSFELQGGEDRTVRPRADTFVGRGRTELSAGGRTV